MVSRTSVGCSGVFSMDNLFAAALVSGFLGTSTNLGKKWSFYPFSCQMGQLKLMAFLLSSPLLIEHPLPQMKVYPFYSRGYLKTQLSTWMNPRILAMTDFSFSAPPLPTIWSKKNERDWALLDFSYPEPYLPSYQCSWTSRKVESKGFYLWNASTTWNDIDKLSQICLHKWNISGWPWFICYRVQADIPLAQ